MRNVKFQIDILQNFEPENEESAIALESLRDGLTEKLPKIKVIDGSILALLKPKGIGRGIR